MKPIAQRWKLVLFILATIGIMSVVGCENKPAEKPDANSTAVKLPTPPPNVQVGPPGNSRPAAQR